MTALQKKGVMVIIYAELSGSARVGWAIRTRRSQERRMNEGVTASAGWTAIKDVDRGSAVVGSSAKSAA